MPITRRGFLGGAAAAGLVPNISALPAGSAEAGLPEMVALPVETTTIPLAGQISQSIINVNKTLEVFLYGQAIPSQATFLPFVKAMGEISNFSTQLTSPDKEQNRKWANALTAIEKTQQDFFRKKIYAFADALPALSKEDFEQLLDGDSKNAFHYFLAVKQRAPNHIDFIDYKFNSQRLAGAVDMYKDLRHTTDEDFEQRIAKELKKFLSQHEITFEDWQASVYGQERAKLKSNLLICLKQIKPILSKFETQLMADRVEMETKVSKIAQDANMPESMIELLNIASFDGRIHAEEAPVFYIKDRQKQLSMMADAITEFMYWSIHHRLAKDGGESIEKFKIMAREDEKNWQKEYLQAVVSVFTDVDPKDVPLPTLSYERFNWPPDEPDAVGAELMQRGAAHVIEKIVEGNSLSPADGNPQVSPTEPVSVLPTPEPAPEALTHELMETSHTSALKAKREAEAQAIDISGSQL